MIPKDYMKAFDDMHTHLKEGAVGEWEISKVTLSEEQVSILKLRDVFREKMSAESMCSDKLVPGMPYTRLVHNGTIFMSDAPMERLTNYDILKRAKGDVLIAGLGLGMLPLAMDKNDEVFTVTIAEKSKEVIDLVLPQLERKMKKFRRLYHVDIFDFKRVTRPMDTFDTIYFDIWPSITTDNLPDMRKLHRSFRSRLREGGIIDSWMYDALLYMERRDRQRSCR